MTFGQTWWRYRHKVKLHWRRHRSEYRTTAVVVLVALTVWQYRAPLAVRWEALDAEGRLEELAERIRPDLQSPKIRPAPSLAPLQIGRGPDVDPEGRPWPSASGYLEGSARLRTDGSMWIEADNSGNRSDVFAKVFWVDPQVPLAVRTVFIKAGDRFTVDELPAGRYEIRYQELASGVFYAAQPVALTLEINPDGSSEFMNWSVGLYPILTGDAPRRVISAEEFAGESG